MKFKLTALILALTVASWAQTTSQNPSGATEQESVTQPAKSDCACCAKMASAKEGKSCCHQKKNGKEEKASCCSGSAAAECCGGESAKACMKGDSDKTTAAAGSSCCGKGGHKGCCASEKKGDKTAMSCDRDKCSEHCAAHSMGAGK